MAVYRRTLSEEEEERLRRLAAMRMGIEQENDAQKTMQEAAGKAAEEEPVSEEWTELEKLDQAVEDGAFGQEGEDSRETVPPPKPEAVMTQEKTAADPDDMKEEGEEAEQNTTEEDMLPQTTQEEPSDKKEEEADQTTDETEQDKTEKPEAEQQKGYAYNGKVYGDGELDLSHDPVAAIAVMHSGGMNAVTEGTIKAANEWAEQSDGFKAVFGILTDENMQEYANIGENGELYELNNRNANSILISNCLILGSTLREFAMKLNDSSFPPELYSDAVGTLLTIVAKAEENAQPGVENIYDDYCEKNKDSADFVALASAFGIYKDLYDEESGLGESLNLAIHEAQERWKTGKGTDQDFALLNANIVRLTDKEKERDPTYKEYITRFGNEDKASYEQGHEDSWLNQQTAQNLKKNGYEPDLTGVEAMSFKGIMLGCRQEAVDMLMDFAHLLNYDDLSTFIKETGFTDEMIDELALHNFRVFEKTFATPQNAQAVESLTAPDDEEQQPVTEANLIEVVCRGFGAGVVEYLSEGAEAFYTWTQSTNIPTDSARVRNKYVAKYGFFGGEKKLYNELMEMSEGGFFPNDNMNTFVKNYLEEGGNPYLLGINPGELGWVAETANSLSDLKEVNDEWSEELSGINRAIYGFSSLAGERVAGMIAENRLIKPLLGHTGLKESADVLTPLFSSGAGWYNTGFDRGMENGLGHGDANMYSMLYSISAWVGNAESISSDVMKAGYSIMLDALKREDVCKFVAGFADYYDKLPQDVKKGINIGQKSALAVIGEYIKDEKENAIDRGAGWVTDNLYGDPNKTGIMMPSDELEAMVRFFMVY